MRVFRTSISALGLAMVIAGTMLTSGCEFAKKVIAKDKLNQGTIVYNQGKTKDAKQYFKEATDLIPTNSVAWLYYGSTVYKDFQNASGEERKKLGEEVLGIFKKALDLAPPNDCKIRDSALGYIANTYSDLDDANNNREWLLKRAEGECATKEIKASTFYSVGVKYWQCSYDQTTRYQDKALTAKGDAFHYRNMDYPAALADKDKALKCVDDALQFLEKSIAEDAEYFDAYFYKALVYREKQKLTKEEPKRKEYGDMAEKITKQAVDLQKKKEAQIKAEEEAKAKQG